MGVNYYIEKMCYEDNIFNLQGWVLNKSNLKTNDIEKVFLVIESESGNNAKCELQWQERKDVSGTFKLSYHEVGFSFRGSIGNFVKVKISLEYVIEGKVKRIEAGQLEGSESDFANEYLQIDCSELFGCYCIDNFQKIGKKYYSQINFKDTIDVIIPVYNGYEYLGKLFESLYKTKISMRVIVVNDCSTDERINSFFENLCNKHQNIIYLKNDTNLGFVKSVNRALRLVENNVALVNTDVEVPENWLERLMLPIFENENVASSTPYTNCGTICSFPNMGKDNDIFDEKSLLFVDSVFKNFVPQYAEMPTGVGFCMGMSIKAIREIGLLDEENFEKGYGEENDWCQRAIKAGYKNVQVENLYVYHKHGGSFSSSEKQRLLEENTKKLLNKHPKYMTDVAKFFDRDPNKVYRMYAYFLCLMQINVPTKVYFNHVLGGGANDYLIKKKEEALKNANKCIECAYDAYNNIYRINIEYKQYSLSLYSEDLVELLNKLLLSKLDTIYINELVTYPDIYNVLEKIKKLKRDSGAEMIMLGHDYFCVCPTINLLSKEGRFCEFKCSQCNIKNNPFSCDRKYDSIEVWKENWKQFLAECESVIVFSDDSKNIIEKTYGKLENVKVIPHVTDRMLPINKKYKMSKNLNIGILGVLSERKGLKIVKDMLENITKNNLPINIVIVGVCEEDIAGEHCIITGKYTREELPRLMYLYDIDLIFISSVWPETFSYTTEEAMKMNMPIAVFDLGAPAERVKKYDKGLIIHSMNAEIAIEEIRKFAIKFVSDKAVVDNKILFLIEYESFSSRYRVEHLRERLAMNGVYSKTMDIRDVAKKNIKEYNVISIYRCSEYDIVEPIVAEAKKNDIKVIYDIDDYIFNYEEIKHLDFLKDKEYEDFEKYSNNIRRCMELCDVLSASTISLSQAMKKDFPDKEVVVCRNQANLEMQLLSEIAIDNNKKDKNDKVVLGYFSGSKTHNKDWELIEDSVIEILQSNDNVYLLICGVLELSSKFKPFEKRIIRVPFVDWRKLPQLIRSIDINLMPLEDGFFQQCKSENKWMEAGLVGVPTVASKNFELQQVVIDEQNIVFCEDLYEWTSKLQQLVRDKSLRVSIGIDAKKHITNKRIIECVEEISNIYF